MESRVPTEKHAKTEPNRHIRQVGLARPLSCLVIDVKGWICRKTTHLFLVLISSRSMNSDREALLAEERKLRRLSRAMDIAAILLWEVDLTLEEAQEIVNHAKHTALQLFPDKEATFDLIYGPRFRRILVEKYHLQ
jgi:hypothetical protein